MAAHQQGDGLWLTVVDRGSQEHLGVVAAHLMEQDLEVGVWITPDRWSTGLAREALLAVLPGLRRRFPAQQVVAEADVQHAASDRLLRSVGSPARTSAQAGTATPCTTTCGTRPQSDHQAGACPGGDSGYACRGSAAAIRTTASRQHLR